MGEPAVAVTKKKGALFNMIDNYEQSKEAREKLVREKMEEQHMKKQLSKKEQESNN